MIHNITKLELFVFADVVRAHNVQNLKKKLFMRTYNDTATSLNISPMHRSTFFNRGKFSILNLIFNF